MRFPEGLGCALERMLSRDRREICVRDMPGTASWKLLKTFAHRGSGAGLSISHVWVSTGRILPSLNSCVFTELSGHAGTRSNYSCLRSAVRANQNSQGLGTLAPCYLFVCTYWNLYKRGVNSFPLAFHLFFFISFLIFFNYSALAINYLQHL